MNASAFRNTKFEIVSLIQGPNSFLLKVTERAVIGSTPPEIEIHESEFSDLEMSQVHAALKLLESKAAAVFARKLGTLGLDAGAVMPAAIHALVLEADEAEKRKTEAQEFAKALEAEAEAKKAELAKLSAEIEAMQAAKAAAETKPADPAPDTPANG